MPVKSHESNQVCQCKYFRWRIYTRDNGVYYADGRYDNHEHKVGRYSLETTRLDEAMATVHELDRAKAVELKLARPEILGEQVQTITLEAAVQMYQKFVTRSRAVGGARKTTAKRYRAVVNKFTEFAHEKGLRTWNQVNENVLTDYANYLDEDGYAYRTVTLEITTLLQINKHLIEDAKLLPESSRIRMRMKKARFSPTFRPTTAQLMAMIEHCRRNPDLHWLADVIHTLAGSGMRIGELAALRWDAVEQDLKNLAVLDETTTGSREQRQKSRSTKNGESRRVPIQEQVRPVFARPAAQAHGPRDLVFRGLLGGKIKPDQVRVALKRDVFPQVAATLPAQEREDFLRCTPPVVLARCRHAVKNRRRPWRG